MQDYANAFRKRYDPNYMLIPPHITLTGPFRANKTEAKKIANQLHSIGREFHPIHLHAYKISSFQPVNNVIYLKIKPSAELKDLHKRLLHLYMNKGEYAFVPHITIGQELSNDEHSDIYGALRMTNVDLTETTKRFHLLYQLENGSWSVYETVRLGEVEE